MKNFTSNLLKWHQDQSRILPWKKNKDPYQIWVSEIILQQTRVKQGTPYYHRFLETFPTIESLANAEEDEVLKVWQGLGYYSRARNMHKAAQQIMIQFEGVFPSQYEDILSLKGIGPYTAAAISSFAFDLPKAVVDGNVIRVLTRFAGITADTSLSSTQKRLTALALELLDKENPARHNQAIMDFGAMHCKPQNPLCGSCLMNKDCYAFKNQQISQLPFKEKKVKVKNRFLHYFDIRYEDQILLKRRGEKDIWAGLYDLPCIEKDAAALIKGKEILKYLSQLGLEDENIESFDFVIEERHVLTHQKIKAFFYRIILRSNPLDRELPYFVDQKKISNFALSRLLQKYLNSHLK